MTAIEEYKLEMAKAAKRGAKKRRKKLKAIKGKQCGNSPKSRGK